MESSLDRGTGSAVLLHVLVYLVSGGRHLERGRGAGKSLAFMSRQYLRRTRGRRKSRWPCRRTMSRSRSSTESFMRSVDLYRPNQVRLPGCRSITPGNTTRPTIVGKHWPPCRQSAAQLSQPRSMGRSMSSVAVSGAPLSSPRVTPMSSKNMIGHRLPLRVEISNAAGIIGMRVVTDFHDIFEFGD